MKPAGFLRLRTLMNHVTPEVHNNHPFKTSGKDNITTFLAQTRPKNELLEHFTPEPSMAPRTLKNSFGDDE
jgi:hypothetical protein